MLQNFIFIGILFKYIHKQQKYSIKLVIIVHFWFYKVHYCKSNILYQIYFNLRKLAQYMYFFNQQQKYSIKKYQFIINSRIFIQKLCLLKLQESKPQNKYNSNNQCQTFKFCLLKFLNEMDYLQKVQIQQTNINQYDFIGGQQTRNQSYNKICSLKICTIKFAVQKREINRNSVFASNCKALQSTCKFAQL
eukprot:TRINITY_DN26385_c0_g2_i3.p1 TRINITY_DN26385_c0_g2~~TRINITY_DN26385_c0_g2_i3.p1  ORF type:complete len:191 (-),score=-19.89 TRINITY_DN26385_c0_g2_i3:60-632(-)